MLRRNYVLQAWAWHHWLLAWCHVCKRWHAHRDYERNRRWVKSHCAPDPSYLKDGYQLKYMGKATAWVLFDLSQQRPIGPARELTDWAEDFYKMPKALLQKAGDGAITVGRTKVKAQRRDMQPPPKLRC